MRERKDDSNLSPENNAGDAHNMVTHIRDGSRVVGLLPTITFQQFRSCNLAKKHIRELTKLIGPGKVLAPKIRNNNEFRSFLIDAHNNAKRASQ